MDSAVLNVSTCNLYPYESFVGDVPQNKAGQVERGGRVAMSCDKERSRWKWDPRSSRIENTHLLPVGKSYEILSRVIVLQVYVFLA